MPDYQAGHAFLQIHPSLEGFPEELAAKLKGVNPEITVKVKPDLDTAGVDTSAGEAGQSAGKKYSDAFAQTVRSRIRAALEALPAITPDVDATEAQAVFAELRAELEDLGNKNIGVDIDPADALIALAEVRDKLRELEFDSNQSIDIRVDATTASGQLDALLRQVKELDHFTAKIDVSLNEGDFALAEAQLEKLKRDASDSQSQTSSRNADGGGIGGGRLGYLATLGAVGGTLGGGAISSAALLAIPVAFAAIGVAAEKSNLQVKQSFADLKSTAKDVSSTAFEPFINTFQRLATTATATLIGLKGPLNQAATAAAPLIDTLGTGLINAVRDGVNDVIPTLGHIAPVVSAISGGFGQLEKAVTGFFATLNAQTAGTALTGLFSVVQQLLPALADLLNAVTPLGTALANVLGSALKSTAAAISGLAPILNVVAGALQSVSGFIGAQVPLILTFMVTVRLLSGSWTNFSGALARSTSIWNGFTGLFNTSSTQFARLASLVGITTAAENQRTQGLARSTAVMAEAAVADAQLAKIKAQAAATTAAQTAAEAEATAATAGTAEATVASGAASLEATASRAQLARADLELVAAEEAAAEAETALAATTDAMSFSIMPILGIVALAGAAFGAFALSNRSTAAAAQDVSQQLIQLGGHVQGVNGAVGTTSADLQKYSDDLKRVGSSATQFGAAYSSSIAVAKSYTEGLQQAQAKLGQQTIVLTKAETDRDAQLNAANKTGQIHNVEQLAKAVNGNTKAYQALDGPQKTALDNYNAFNDIIPQAINAQKGAEAAAAATTEALASQGIVLTAGQNAWNKFGNGVATNAKNFNEATSGIKGLTDAAVTSQGAFFQAQANFKQLDQAVVQAQSGVTQARAGVTNAVHGIATAAQGVADARHQEAASALGVVQAQQQVVQAHQQEVQAQQQVVQSHQQEVEAQAKVTKAQFEGRQAQLALTQAKVDAARAIADLNRQVTDQGDSEDDARVRLIQAQQAVKAAGLQNKSLASLGAPTTANLASYQLLLTQQEAQHNLNNQLVQSARLKQQQRTTDAAGVHGSSQVVSATQGVAQAQDQLRKAVQGVTQAQQGSAQAQQGLVQSKQGVQQAVQGVTDASYQEKQSHLQVREASYQETQAQVTLQQAKVTLSQAIAAKGVATANDTRVTSLNSAQGVQNFQTVEQLFEDNLTLTGNVQTATKMTEAQGKAMGITSGSIHSVIDAVTGLNGKQAVFGVVGQPSINLTELIKAASDSGVDPKTLGFSAAALAAAGNARRNTPTGSSYATGGLVSGPGTGTSDSILAAGDAGFHHISNGEYVVNAKSTAANLPLIEAINNAPGHAAGGLIATPQDITAIPKANVRIMELGSIAQAIRSSLSTIGVKTNNLTSLPHSNPADAMKLGATLASAPTGGGGASTQGGQIAYSAGHGVAQWAPQILAALQMLGQPASWLQTIERRMNQESGGQPNIVNLWDSNAKKGTPSKGLMQVIDPTFGAYHSPALSPNIYDPEANIYAGLNYAIHRYGSLSALNRPGGYDNGGFLPPGLQMVYNATGKPERVFNEGQWDSISKGGLGGGGPMHITGNLQVNGLDAHIDGRIEAADSATSQLISGGTR
jgi:SLT domain-containing protein